MIEKLSYWIVKHMKILLPVAAVILIAFPFVFTNPYVTRIATVALMYSMLAISLNLLIGILGIMSFGHAAFFGLGAYTCALLVTKLGLGSGVTFIGAAVMGGIAGLLLGLTVLKLKGFYFTIVTMVFCEILRIIELNWMDFTGGSLGIKGISAPTFFGITLKSPTANYFLIFVLLAITILVVRNIQNSRSGFAIQAIRDDEIAAASCGINVFKYKMLVFIISSMLAALAGAFYAQYTKYIDPSAFTMDISNDILLMTIFGGLGNIFGSIFGAVVLSVLPELLRGFSTYRPIVYGLLLIIMMLVKPDGLFGSIRFKYLSQRLAAGVAPALKKKAGKKEEV